MNMVNKNYFFKLKRCNANLLLICLLSTLRLLNAASSSIDVEVNSLRLQIFISGH